MRVLCIDPGPKLSGYVIVDNDIITDFGKVNLNALKMLRGLFDTIIIEVTDWPIANAGESYRDTCIVIGRLIEYYQNKSIILKLGRKATRNHFKLKNDSDVIRFLKSKGIKKLVADSWQAYLLYYFYKHENSDTSS